MLKSHNAVSLRDAKEMIDTWPLSRPYGVPVYLVLETYDFSRDINGNTINKYRASLHCSDLESVANTYDGNGLTVLKSPYRREQSQGDGSSMALHWLDRLGYELESARALSFDQGKGRRSHRLIFEVKNI